MGNDPVNKIDPTGMQSGALEEVLVSVPKPPENPFCLCLVGAAAQSLVNAMAEQQERNMAMMMTGIVLASSMLSENSNESSDADAQPKEENLTKIKERDGNKAAEEAGFKDAHEAKKGRGDGGVDIYRDKSSGKTWLWNGTKGAEKELL